MMTLNGLFTAALMTIAGVSPIAIAAPAAAQHTVVHERTVVRHDRGPGFRRHAQTRRVCSVERRHGHRERVCRTVRNYR